VATTHDEAAQGLPAPPRHAWPGGTPRAKRLAARTVV